MIEWTREVIDDFASSKIVGERLVSRLEFPRLARNWNFDYPR